MRRDKFRGFILAARFGNKVQSHERVLYEIRICPLQMSVCGGLFSSAFPADGRNIMHLALYVKRLMLIKLRAMSQAWRHT